MEDGDRRRNNRNDEEEEESSEEEEVTPYQELLSMFSKSKGSKKNEVQILSDEDEESEDEDEVDQEEDDKDDDGDDGDSEMKEGETLVESKEVKKEVLAGSKKADEVEEAVEDEDKEETVIVEAEIDLELVRCFNSLFV